MGPRLCSGDCYAPTNRRETCAVPSTASYRLPSPSLGPPWLSSSLSPAFGPCGMPPLDALVSSAGALVGSAGAFVGSAGAFVGSARAFDSAGAAGAGLVSELVELELPQPATPRATKVRLNAAHRRDLVLGLASDDSMSMRPPWWCDGGPVESRLVPQGGSFRSGVMRPTQRPRHLQNLPEESAATGSLGLKRSKFPRRWNRHDRREVPHQHSFQTRTDVRRLGVGACRGRLCEQRTDRAAPTRERPGHQRGAIGERSDGAPVDPLASAGRAYRLDAQRARRRQRCSERPRASVPQRARSQAHAVRFISDHLPRPRGGTPSPCGQLGRPQSNSRHNHVHRPCSRTGCRRHAHSSPNHNAAPEPAVTNPPPPTGGIPQGNGGDGGGDNNGGPSDGDGNI